MGKRDDELDKLRAANMQLRRRLEQSETSTGTPELDELNRVYTMAVWLADPLTATRLDATRSMSQDFLAASGRTTREGQSTAQARHNVTRLKADIRHLAKRWRDTLDGTVKPRKDDQPRCWVRTSEHRRGLRLPYGSKVCPVCLAELKNDE